MPPSTALCGAEVNGSVTHGLGCSKSQGNHLCHMAINKMIQHNSVCLGRGLLFHQRTWARSASEYWRATATSSAVTKDCCSHAEGNTLLSTM